MNRYKNMIFSSKVLNKVHNKFIFFPHRCQRPFNPSTLAWWRAGVELDILKNRILKWFQDKCDQRIRKAGTDIHPFRPAVIRSSICIWSGHDLRRFAVDVYDHFLLLQAFIFSHSLSLSLAISLSISRFLSHYHSLSMIRVIIVLIITIKIIMTIIRIMIITIWIMITVILQ